MSLQSCNNHIEHTNITNTFFEYIKRSFARVVSNEPSYNVLSKFELQSS